jgi:hypothetical protein
MEMNHTINPNRPQFLFKEAPKNMQSTGGLNQSELVIIGYVYSDSHQIRITEMPTIYKTEILRFG